MHIKGTAHRDLKVENILLKNQKFKVADFGSAEKEDSFVIWEKISKLD